MKNLKKKFLEMNNNCFIDKNSNKIIVDTIEEIKIEEIRQFWFCLNNFIKMAKNATLISHDFIWNNFSKEFSRAFEINNKPFIFVKCFNCKNMVKKASVKLHFKKCNEKLCNFVHVDGIKCNSILHIKNLHKDFVEFSNFEQNCKQVNYMPLDSLTENEPICQEIQTLDNTYSVPPEHSKYYIKNLKSQNVIIKNLNFKSVINQILEMYSNNFRILAKHCKCITNLTKYCNCFISFLNNIDCQSYKLRQKKKKFYGMRDFLEKKYKLICVIIVNYNENHLNCIENVDFFQNIRNSDDIKFVFLVPDDYNYHLIYKSIFKKYNIAYQSKHCP